MGFYTRANAEYCLIGTRGSPKRKDAGVHSIVEAVPGRHSEKPEEVRHRIERLYDGPYVELFARVRASDWDAWGLDIGLEGPCALHGARRRVFSGQGMGR